jgi:hypothetical protein
MWLPKRVKFTTTLRYQAMSIFASRMLSSEAFPRYELVRQVRSSECSEFGRPVCCASQRADGRSSISKFCADHCHDVVPPDRRYPLW